MKLISVKINSYKNIAGSYSFVDNKGYIALIGLNGSGKSNFLEAVSIIFDKLINYNGKGIPFDYEIEYELNDHIFFRKKGEAKKDGKGCKANEIVYPSSIIACYSGEDLRLWRIAFEKYHMGYFNNAINKSQASPKMLYINKYCWKIALIALVCSNNLEVKTFLKNTLHIDDPQKVEVSFGIDDTKKGIFKTHAAINWFNNISQDGLKDINLKSISSYDIYEASLPVPEDLKSKYVFNFLYLLSQPKKNEINRVDKLIDSIKLTLYYEKYIIDFDDLSEGEKKLILIECITKVLGDENSLVLLDEPDAHTHIAMKKDLLKLISEFKGQTVMTTHSPMFLNKRWDGYIDSNIFFIRDGKIEATDPLLNLANLTDNEIDYFEGAFILSSKRILVTEGPYDISYIKHAIDKFAEEKPEYLKLKENVAFLHAGGSDNAEALYELTLYPSHSHYDNLVFLFDYDKAGYEGLEKVKKLVKRFGDTKTKLMFYQKDYSIIKDRKPQDKDSDSYMAEDLFAEEAYKCVVDKIHVRSHKEFRNLGWTDVILSNKRPKSTTEAIKYYIQDNYASFGKELLNNFKPILDELLNVFALI